MRCRLFHQWSKWSISERIGGIKYNQDTGKEITKFPLQERTCERCGKTQARKMF